LEAINIKFPERSDEEDQEDQKNEEEFLTAVSESVDKLGQYCLEIYGSVNALLPGLSH
jgi:hypothetical protein